MKIINFKTNKKVKKCPILIPYQPPINLGLRYPSSGFLVEQVRARCTAEPSQKLPRPRLFKPFKEDFLKTFFKTF